MKKLYRISLLIFMMYVYSLVVFACMSRFFSFIFDFACELAKNPAISKNTSEFIIFHIVLAAIFLLVAFMCVIYKLISKFLERR